MTAVQRQRHHLQADLAERAGPPDGRHAAGQRQPDARSGTASVVGLSTNANLGTLREVAGAASSLAILTQPSATATAGVAFAQQPVLQVRDQFGNLRSAANGVTNSTVVTAARGSGSGTLQGTLTADGTHRWRGHLHRSVPQRRHQHHASASAPRA